MGGSGEGVGEGRGKVRMWEREVGGSGRGKRKGQEVHRGWKVEGRSCSYIKVGEGTILRWVHWGGEARDRFCILKWGKGRL